MEVDRGDLGGMTGGGGCVSGGDTLDHMTIRKVCRFYDFSLDKSGICLYIRYEIVQKRWDLIMRLREYAMLTSRKWLRLILIACAVFGLLTLYAQEKKKDIFMYLPKDWTKEQVGDKAIDNGYVVVFGRLIPRPYYVEFRNDTIFINDIPYLPKIKDPDLPPGAASQEEIQRRSLEFDIGPTYLYYKRHHGEQKAKEMIVADYQSHPRIVNMTFNEDASELWVELDNGSRVNMLAEYLVRSYKGPRRSVPERREDRMEEVGKVRARLNSGGMIFLGRRGSVTKYPAKSARVIYETVLDLRNANISLEEKKKRLFELFHHETPVNDIVENIDTWE
jgi:hypothetical protein